MAERVAAAKLFDGVVDHEAIIVEFVEGCGASPTRDEVGQAKNADPALEQVYPKLSSQALGDHSALKVRTPLIAHPFSVARTP
ncbi:MAG: hypothetical protein ACRDSL_01865 [Pseudonocardiaceae bacterium]